MIRTPIREETDRPEMKAPAYNHRVFLIEDIDERDQCQFVYVPLNGEPPKRCQKDGIYRIGLTIFLCGVHMPGVGRHPNAKAKAIKPKTSETLVIVRDEKGGERKVTKESIHGRLLALLVANKGVVVNYSQIEESIPSLSVRSRIQTVVSQLRKWTGAHIVSVTHVGYKYILDAEE